MYEAVSRVLKPKMDVKYQDYTHYTYGLYSSSSVGSIVRSPLRRNCRFERLTLELE